MLYSRENHANGSRLEVLIFMKGLVNPVAEASRLDVDAGPGPRLEPVAGEETFGHGLRIEQGRAPIGDIPGRKLASIAGDAFEGSAEP